MRGRALLRAVLAAASTLGSVAAMAQEALVLPVPGSEINIDKVPADVLTVGAPAFEHTKTSDLIQAMIRAIPYGQKLKP